MVRQMDFSVGSKIQDIQKKISDLTRSLETYGIKTVRESEASSSRYELQQRRRRTYPHLIEEDVVGLEENVKELVNYLVRDEKCQVITTQKVLFYTFKSLCFKHFCVVILHLYSNWHVKDLAMTPNHICG